ncbi:MAG: hypothetical protein NZO16_04230 [Deltaproteobacteria bacterium]|nr:hypothetical protein [Deltaproteobacteria bacterium]
MRSILIFLILFGCSSYSNLFLARKYSRQGSFDKAEAEYLRFLSQVGDKNKDKKVYYTLELCDFYIANASLEKAESCLSNLKTYSEYSAMIVPRIKNLVIRLTENQGLDLASKVLQKFLPLDPEYLEGIYDSLAKTYLNQQKTNNR